VTRLATSEDAPALARMLARAFDDDPVLVWAHPDARRRPRRGAGFFAGRLRSLLDNELCWTTDELAGAALWAPADAWAAPAGELVRGLPYLTLRRAPLVLYGLGNVERAHPREPHYYLSVLGVDPAYQRRGLGSRLLAPGLELCDREGVPAYLETGKLRNVGFYERHGFRVTREMALPRGPTVWLMWRDPR
jgi:ribosomal protein S18 acetylase RimI-like enzyme